MRDFFLRDCRLKLFSLVLAILIWEAIHLATGPHTGQRRPPPPAISPTNSTQTQ